MEHEFTKQEILETYLNVIFFGQRAYGVAAAAETYFGKPLDQLSVAEAATLAGIAAGALALQPDHQPASAPPSGALCAAAHAGARLHRRRHGRSAPTRSRSRRATHAPLYDVEAPYVAEMARARGGAALRRGADQRRLPGLHHDRRPAADRGQSRAAARADRIRPPPRLPRRRCATSSSTPAPRRRSSRRCWPTLAADRQPAPGGGGLGRAQRGARVPA